MIFHENRLLADDSHEISYFIFLKIGKHVKKFVVCCETVFVSYFRVNELTMTNEKLKIQVEERDKTVSNLRKAIEHLELKVGERNFADLQESEISRQIRDETESLHNALRNIAESVLNDADDEASPDEALARARSSSPSRDNLLRARSKSPLARSRSPAFADATFSAVQAALNKRQLQVFMALL